MNEDRIVAEVVTRNAPAPYAVAVEAGPHAFTADEPQENGGGHRGPSPHALLLSGLGACTAITLRMYAERKQWPLEGVEVLLRCRHGGGGTMVTIVDRTLRLTGPLDDGQRARLADIAERTPVTKLVKAGAEVRTTLG